MMHPPRLNRLLLFVFALTFPALLCLRPLSAASSGPLLLDAAQLEDGTIVAVGGDGLILRSTTADPNWARANTPHGPTLCGVSFVDSQTGFAVGHNGVILRSDDGGANWSPARRTRERIPTLLDVLALDARHAIAVGAEGTYYQTQDSGRTWRRSRPSEMNAHLNRIVRSSQGTLFIAGENGVLLRSRDEGGTWEQLEADPTTSYFGVLPLTDGVLLAPVGSVRRQEDLRRASGLARHCARRVIHYRSSVTAVTQVAVRPPPRSDRPCLDHLLLPDSLPRPAGPAMRGSRAAPG